MGGALDLTGSFELLLRRRPDSASALAALSTPSAYNDTISVLEPPVTVLTVPRGA